MQHIIIKCIITYCHTDMSFMDIDVRLSWMIYKILNSVVKISYSKFCEFYELIYASPYIGQFIVNERYISQG